MTLQCLSNVSPSSLLSQSKQVKVLAVVIAVTEAQKTAHLKTKQFLSCQRVTTCKCRRIFGFHSQHMGMSDTDKITQSELQVSVIINNILVALLASKFLVV